MWERTSFVLICADATNALSRCQRCCRAVRSTLSFEEIFFFAQHTEINVIFWDFYFIFCSLTLPHFSFLLPLRNLPYRPSFSPTFHSLTFLSLFSLPKLPYKPSFLPTYSNSLIIPSFSSLIYYQFNPNIKSLPDAIRADIVAIFAPCIPPCPCPLDVKGIAEMIFKMKRKAIDMLDIRKKEI